MPASTTMMVCRRIRLFLVRGVWALGIVSNASGQYFQFTQYDFTRQRVNPGMIGTSRYAAVDFDYRNQKTGGDFNINSSFFSANVPLLNQSTGRAWSGVGFTLMDDRSSGMFKTQEVSLTYAINIQLAKNQILSLGVKGLYLSQRISFDGFYTGSQYIPDRGFSNVLSSGEEFRELTSSFQTLSGGIYWQQTDRSGLVSAYWGISMFDFNKPETSFVGAPQQISSTAVFTGGFTAFQQGAFSVLPEMLFTSSASNSVINLGARFRREINPRPKQISDRVEVLTKYVVGRSGIVGFQFHRENVSLGISYDFPLLTSNPGNVGALELGLELRRLVIPKARRKSIARRKDVEDRRKPKPVVTPTQARQDVQPVRDTLSTPAPVEISAGDSVKARAEASAGHLSHEALVVEKITLRFHFEFNSFDLDDETEKYLDELAATLKEDTNLRLRITGHTDNVGNVRFNEKLSLRRAEVVREFLVDRGVESSRLVTVGKGMDEPVNGNDTAEDRARNRRVEMLLFYER